MEGEQDLLLRGTVVRGNRGSYVIVGALGRDTIGIVYLAESAESGLRVALREFFPVSLECSRRPGEAVMDYPKSRAAEVGGYMRAFEAEASAVQTAGSVSRHVARVYDVFEANGTAYFTTDYLQGPTLRQFVESNGPLTAAQADFFLRPVAEGVASLHALQVAHYDINPDNIVITRQSDGGTVTVLAGCGIARSALVAGGAGRVADMVGCSGVYSPLEQKQSRVNGFMPSVDVYSLAAVYWFCLTGRPPMAAESMPERYVVAELGSSLPHNRLEALRHAMLPDPAARTADAQLFVAGFFDGRMPVASVRRNTAVSTAARQSQAVPAAPAPGATVSIERTEPLGSKRGGKALLWIIPLALAAVAAAAYAFGFLDFATAEAEDDEEPAVAVADAGPRLVVKLEHGHTGLQNLDLLTRHNGGYIAFTAEEWAAEPADTRDDYEPLGLVVIADEGSFCVSLHDSGEKMTWADAVARYGSDRLPSESRCRALAADHKAVCRAIEAFGGDSNAKWWYWGQAKDKERAWGVGMFYGYVGATPKTDLYMVRTVEDVPLEAL